MALLPFFLTKCDLSPAQPLLSCSPCTPERHPHSHRSILSIWWISKRQRNGGEGRRRGTLGSTLQGIALGLGSGALVSSSTGRREVFTEHSVQCPGHIVPIPSLNPHKVLVRWMCLSHCGHEGLDLLDLQRSFQSSYLRLHERVSFWGSVTGREQESWCVSYLLLHNK